jgi:septation ring formation regulator EzrA
MTQATDTDIQDIKTSIEANTKAISDLTTSFTGLREEMRVGFANVTTQITRLDGKIDKLEIKLDSKIDNRFDVMTAKLNNIDINAKNTVDLAEKIGELKNWKQIAIVVFTASVSGAIAWYLRGGNQ